MRCKVSESERLQILDEEFAKYRESTDARLRRMRNVIHELHKKVCTGTDCPVCKALDE